MKLAVIGSRGITELELTPYIPENTTEIISGGAKGIDTLAEEYADKFKLSKHIIRPDYKKYPSKSAPIIRNKLIIDHCDSVLVFWDGKSKGTLSALDYAKKIDKPVKIVEVLLNPKH